MATDAGRPNPRLSASASPAGVSRRPAANGSLAPSASASDRARSHVERSRRATACSTSVRVLGRRVPWCALWMATRKALAGASSTLKGRPPTSSVVTYRHRIDHACSGGAASAREPPVQIDDGAILHTTEGPRVLWSGSRRGFIVIDAYEPGIGEQSLGARPVASLDEQVGVPVKTAVGGVVEEGVEGRPLQQDRGDAVRLEHGRDRGGDLIDVTAPGLLRELEVDRSGGRGRCGRGVASAHSR